MASAPPAERRLDRRSLLLGVASGSVFALILGGALWFSFARGSGASIAPPRGEPGVAVSAQERRGEVLYNVNCVTCHGGPTGGTMMDYPPRHNANGHTWHHPDCELKQIVRDGSDAMTDMMREMMAPPNAPSMQAFKDRLSDDEIDAVLAYIKTMWTPNERAVQAEITRQSCATASAYP